LKKRAAHLAIPDVGPMLEKRNVFGSRSRLPEGAVCCVLKRAHHTGDVAEGRAFEFALAHRTGGFAFEIENDKIFSGVEDLAEVIIAVNPNLSGVGFAI